MSICLKDLPNELLLQIFDYLEPNDIKKIYFKFKNYKSCLDEIIYKNNIGNRYYEDKINIPGSYIIKRVIDKKLKEQIVTIDDYEYNPKTNTKIFCFNYGIMGFHEGFSRIENIRELTNKEKQFLKEGNIFKLPQQFYHSIPY